MIVPLQNELEAHYIAAIFNSLIVVTFVASSYIETSISDITKRIEVPKFDSNNNNHLDLAELSKQAHILTKKIYEKNDLGAQNELNEVEHNINSTVAKLYGIKGMEFEEIRKNLIILKGDAK